MSDKELVEAMGTAQDDIVFSLVRGKIDKGDDLPKTIFKQLLNLSGLGPIRYEFKSFAFRTTELKILRP